MNRSARIKAAAQLPMGSAQRRTLLAALIREGAGKTDQIPFKDMQGLVSFVEDMCIGDDTQKVDVKNRWDLWWNRSIPAEWKAVPEKLWWDTVQEILDAKATLKSPPKKTTGKKGSFSKGANLVAVTALAAIIATQGRPDQEALAASQKYRETASPSAQQDGAGEDQKGIRAAGVPPHASFSHFVVRCTDKGPVREGVYRATEGEENQYWAVSLDSKLKATGKAKEIPDNYREDVQKDNDEWAKKLLGAAPEHISPYLTPAIVADVVKEKGLKGIKETVKAKGLELESGVIAERREKRRQQGDVEQLKLSGKEADQLAKDADLQKFLGGSVFRKAITSVFGKESQIAQWQRDVANKTRDVNKDRTYKEYVEDKKNHPSDVRMLTQEQWEKRYKKTARLSLIRLAAQFPRRSQTRQDLLEVLRKA